MREGHAHATVLLWRSKDTSWFAPSTVDLGDQTLMVGSPSKSFYLLSHLSGASHRLHWKSGGCGLVEARQENVQDPLHP